MFAQVVIDGLKQFKAVFASLEPLDQERCLHQLIQEIRYNGPEKDISLRLYPPFEGYRPQADVGDPGVEYQCPIWLLGLDSNQQPSG